jgi:hypothetical protein
LRGAFVPLAIPIGAIGLVVGGLMYVFGNRTPAGRCPAWRSGWR